jgi:hypothetical protein
MTLGEAEAAISALDAAGIPCALDDENIIGVQWMNAQAVGWVKVVVADEDVENAAEILASPAVVDESETRPAESAVTGCPRCGSPEVHRVYYRRLLVLPFLLAPLQLLALPVLVLLPRWKCDNCGRRSWFR